MQDHGPVSSDPKPGPAVNPLPPVVVILFLAMLAVEGAFFLASKGFIGGNAGAGWRMSAVLNYGFGNDIFDWMLAQGRFPPEHLLRFVTYPFIHVSVTHMVVAGVMTLALGKFVGDVFSGLAVVLIFFAASVMAALVWAVFLNEGRYLLGAFPGVYGLVGGFTFLLWTRLKQSGDNPLRGFSLIGFLMAIQVVFGLLFNGGGDWLADLTGFVTGFALSFVLRPGGLRALRDRMRHE